MQTSWPPTLDFPPNLNNLHVGEEILHQKSTALIAADELLLLHINVVERFMSLADVFRDYPTEDEDLRVIQMYGFRLFNDFSSSYKLMMSGYYQGSAMIMRDILEVVFLLDLFQSDRTAITRWRLANKKARWDEFMPAVLRSAGPPELLFDLTILKRKISIKLAANVGEQDVEFMGLSGHLKRST